MLYVWRDQSMEKRQIKRRLRCKDCSASYDEKTDEFCEHCYENRVFWTQMFDLLPISMGGKDIHKVCIPIQEWEAIKEV